MDARTMKYGIKTIYKYQTFDGQVFDTEADAVEHTAGRLGLTADEYAEYNLLLERERRASARCCLAKNAQTDADFEDAVNLVLDFERKHGL